MAPAAAELATDVSAPMDARWWESQDLPMHPPLHIDSMMPAGESTGVFLQYWQVFLDKLGAPVTATPVGRHHRAAPGRNHPGPVPGTAAHADPSRLRSRQPYSDVDGVGSLRVIDWQLPVRGRGIVDLAYLLSGSLEPSQR